MKSVFMIKKVVENWDVVKKGIYNFKMNLKNKKKLNKKELLKKIKKDGSK